MPRLRERKPKIKVEDVDDDLSNDDNEASGDNNDTDYEPVPQKQTKRKRNIEDVIADGEIAATKADTNSAAAAKRRKTGNKSAPKPRRKKIKSEQLDVNDEQENLENSNLKAKRTLPQSKRGRKKIKVESIEKNDSESISSDLQPVALPNEDLKIPKTEEKEETSGSNPPSAGQSSCDTILKTCQQQTFTRGKVGEAWKDEEVVAEATNVDVWIAKNVITLLDQDCSIPFIVRYRKEMTGGLQAEKLREIQASYDEVKLVHKKVENILKSVKDERLDENLVRSFLSAKTLEEVELLYAPFKPGNKKTLAERSKKLGLEPIALQILEMKTSLSNAKLSSFVKSQKGLETEKEIQTGIQHIIADVIAKDRRVLDFVRQMSQNKQIRIISSKTASAEKEDRQAFIVGGKTQNFKYENYFDLNILLSNVAPHQVMALNRGEKQKVLKVKIQIPEGVKKTITNFIWNSFFNRKHMDKATYDFLQNCVSDAYERLIEPHVCRQIRSDLSKHAEKESIAVFCSNLKSLLLTPPVRGKTVVGVDPGFTHGCKIAAVSSKGDVLATDVIYPHSKSRSCYASDAETLKAMLTTYGAEVIAIGNGTACRETEVWLSDLIKKNFFSPLDVKYCIINESGVSIYSVTKEAELELPDMDPNVRSAVSIARRLQDPLLEYVKVEPKHLGVGMYQHDVPEAQLKKALDSIVEECVSFVGVDLNVCPEFLLRKISGLSATRAKQIVEWRTKNGCFINRQQLLQVKGLGQKSFEQCAGFVKILPETSASASGQVPDAEEEKTKGKKAKKSAVFAPNLLDQTIIHPESYSVAEKFLEEIKGSPQEIGQQSLIDKVSQYMKFKCVENVAVQFSVSVPLMQLIIDAFKQLHDYDIRGEFEQPLFLTSVRTFSDLKVDQKLTGCVRNVTAFGAFVDVGVGADGLIHVSKMKGQKLSVGDKVSVLVKSLDIDKKRLDLELCTDSNVKQEPQSPSSRKAQIQQRPFADLKVNQELTGCVTNITAFGAFVDVGVGKDGLLHVSKMAGQNLNIGDTISVFVQNIDFDKKQLQLNLCTNLKHNQQASTNIKNEQLKPIPFTDLKINQELTGVVKNIAPYGAFVDIGVGPNGLIHISRMRGRELNIGDIVSVVVKSVDFEKKRIELEFCMDSKVKTEPNNFNNLKNEQSKSRQFTDLRVNEELTGFVRNVTMYGAFVDVGVGSNGLIHVSKMKGQHLRVGDNVSVRLRSIDYQRKRLELELLCVC